MADIEKAKVKPKHKQNPYQPKQFSPSSETKQ
jgi:hypothetical protein